MSSDQGGSGGQRPPPQGHGHLPPPQPYGAAPQGPAPYPPTPYPPSPYAGAPYAPPGYPPYGYGQPHRPALDKSTPTVMYILYLAAFVFWPTAIAGLIVAYVNRGGGEPIAHSHYTYGIRTFWLGLLYLCAAWTAAAILLVLAGVVGGTADSSSGAISGLVALCALLILAQLAWWVVRGVRGLVLLSRAQPIPDPGTWLW